MKLLKTSDPRIVMGGKLEQFCPARCLKSFWREVRFGTGEDISYQEFMSYFEDAEMDELANATVDQLYGLAQDGQGYWIITC